MYIILVFKVQQHHTFQIHYNNPMLRANETDRSGLKIYATPNLRKYEASVMNLQQLYLEIPPGQTEHREEAWMTELCTNTLTQDIYITLAAFHMHYLGMVYLYITIASIHKIALVKICINFD